MIIPAGRLCFFCTSTSVWHFAHRATWLTRLTGESLNPVIREGRSDPARFKSFLDKYEIRKIESESYIAVYEKESSFQSRTSLELPSLFDEG